MLNHKGVAICKWFDTIVGTPRTNKTLAGDFDVDFAIIARAFAFRGS